MFSALLAEAYIPLLAQNTAQTYFIDGFHGGIYGHYPQKYTEYLVNCLDSIPEWKIGLEIEPVTWDVASVYETRAFKKFRDYLLEGSRIEYTNPAFAQPYMYNISGESIIRQLTIGMSVLQRHFPGLKIETYSVAEPCFTSCLPTVLTSLGYKYCSTKCPDTIFGGYFSPRSAEVEWWVGPDGESKILNSPRNMAATFDKYCAWSTADHSMTKAYVDGSFAEGFKHPIGMTYQDAVWKIGPWLSIQPEEEKPFVSAPEYAEPEYILWNQYFREVAPLDDADEHTYTQEDMHPSLPWGGQPLQKVAKMTRIMENDVIRAEKISAMASVASGSKYPAGDLRHAWEGLMLSQHHDCWIVLRWWLKNVQTWFGNTMEYCRKAISNSLDSLALKGREGVFTVFNTTGTECRGAVTIPAEGKYHGVIGVNGGPVPSQRWGDSIVFIASTPAFGWRSYSLSEAEYVMKPATSVRKKGRNVVLSNELYDITFCPEKGGAIVSFKDKRTGWEMVDVRDGYPFNGMRAFYPEEDVFHSSGESPAIVETICSGAVRSSVRIKGKMNGVDFIQTVTLDAGDPVVDCSLTLDWKGPSQMIGSPEPEDGERMDDSGNRYTWKMPFYDVNKKMNLLFPTVQKGRIVKDAPFDVCESLLESTSFGSLDSVKHNVILNWADLEMRDGSLALFSDRTTSYSYGPEYPFGLTVQFVGTAHGCAFLNVDEPTTIHYAIVPHSGGWDEDGISCLSDHWNEKMMVAEGAPADAERSLVDLEGTGYQLVTTYIADGDLYVRLFNVSGDETPITINPSFRYSSAELVGLDGRIRETYGTDPIIFSAPRFGLRTLRFHLDTTFLISSRNAYPYSVSGSR